MTHTSPTDPTRKDRQHLALHLSPEQSAPGSLVLQQDGDSPFELNGQGEWQNL